MFDIGWSEMAVILLVALVVIGPRDLPRVARTMGRWVAKGRAMAREFQSALEDMARDAELDKVKSEIEKAGRRDLGKTIERHIDPKGELGKAFDPNAKSPSKPAPGGKKKTAGDRGAEPTPPPAATPAEPEPVMAQAEPARAEPEPAAPATTSRPRAKAAERETVPADPS